MHVLDLNRLAQFFINSLELVLILRPCAVLEFIFPAYQYSLPHTFAVFGTGLFELVSPR